MGIFQKKKKTQENIEALEQIVKKGTQELDFHAQMQDMDKKLKEAKKTETKLPQPLSLISKVALSPEFRNQNIFEDADQASDEEDILLVTIDYQKKKKKRTSKLQQMSPEELFKKFDVEGSGYISLDEFKAILPEAGIFISDAKALKIFKSCDTDNGGEIDFDEFQMALYAMNPNNGNTLGFAPNSLLSPKDVFLLFDEDGSGQIDDATFDEALEYLGLNISDEKQEKIFRKYDTDRSGYIDYDEFRKMWLSLSNVIKELEARGIDIPKSASDEKLKAMLERLLEEEEELENKVLIEAKWYHDWLIEKKRRERLAKSAYARSRYELASAIDAAGQVYVFGAGQNNQFSGTPNARDPDLYEGSDVILETWLKRIIPHYEEQVPRRKKRLHQNSLASQKTTQSKGLSDPGEGNVVRESEEHQELVDLPQVADNQGVVQRLKKRYTKGKFVERRLGNNLLGSMGPKKFDKRSIGDIVNQSKKLKREANETTDGADKIDPFTDRDKNEPFGTLLCENREYIESLRFKDLRALPTTAWLWGQRIIQGAMGDNVLYSITDTGDVFCWGGREPWWKPLHQDNESMPNTSSDGTFSNTTPRSTLQQGWMDEHHERERDIQLQAQNNAWKKIEDKRHQEQQEYSRMKSVIMYFDRWKDPLRQNDRIRFINEELMPLVDQGKLREALEFRGFTVERQTKNALVALFADCLEIEAKSKEFLSDEQRLIQPATNGDLPTADDINKLIKLQEDMKSKNNRLERGVVSKVVSQKVEKLGAVVRNRLDDDRDGTYQEALSFKQMEKRASVLRNNRNEDKKEEYQKLRKDMLLMWKPLMVQLRDEEDRKKEAQRQKLIQDYNDKNERLELRMLSRKLKQGNSLPEYTARGLSKKFQLSGITERGLPPSSPRGASTASQVCAGAHHSVLISDEGHLYSWGLGVSGRLGHGVDHSDGTCPDVGYPRLIESLKSTRFKNVSASYAHSCAVTVDGEVYAWGSTSTGKLGIGDIGKEYLEFTLLPVQTRFPGGRKIRQISCGYAHTGAVTTLGELYVWGCANGGRLGLGAKVKEMVAVPTLVKTMLHTRVYQISCGRTHSLLCTEVKRDVTGKQGAWEGGEVYVCGDRGPYEHTASTWCRVESLLEETVKQVSAGVNHSAAITTNGELFTWGKNSGGCTGHSVEIPYIRVPTLVKALQISSRIVSLHRHCEQSSIYNEQGPHIAVNGERGGAVDNCIHTQIDECAWWQVDLGQPTVIQKIRVWNRGDQPNHPLKRRDEFESRLFPFWIFISELPFPDMQGKPSLNANRSQSAAFTKIRTGGRMIEWVLSSAETVGQHIRIQLDGTNFLHIAEVEVFGVYSAFNYIGDVSSVECGHDATLCILRPLSDKKRIDDHFRRAVHADPSNAFILRNFDTYFQVYKRYSRGDGQKSSGCLLCRAFWQCEICDFFRGTPSENLQPDAMGGPPSLKQAIEEILMREPPKPFLESKKDIQDRKQGISVAQQSKLLLKLPVAGERKHLKSMETRNQRRGVNSNTT